VSTPQDPRALPDEELAALERYHRLEAQRLERRARRHRAFSGRALDEIGRRAEQRKRQP